MPDSERAQPERGTDVEKQEHQGAALGADPIDSELAPPTRAFWAKQTPEMAAKYVEDLKQEYVRLSQEFTNRANSCLQRSLNFHRKQRRWRWSAILVTGLVAILNMIAAYFAGRQADFAKTFREWFPLGVAVVAGLLAVIINLESYEKSAEKAQAYRQARELYLDASRQARERWTLYVAPFQGANEQLCLNAARLLRWIRQRDKELRSSIQQLTMIDVSKGSTT